MAARVARAKLRIARPYRRKLGLRLRLPPESERNDRDNPPTGGGKTVTTSRDKTAAPAARPMPNPKGTAPLLSRPPGKNRAPFRPDAEPSALLQLSPASAAHTDLVRSIEAAGWASMQITLWHCGSNPRAPVRTDSDRSRAYPRTDRERK